MDIILPLAAMVLLLGLSAFFSASESALFSLNQVQVRHLSAGKTGAALRRLLHHPGDLLVVVLSGNLLVNVGLTSVGTLVCIRYFGQMGAEVAVLAITPLLLLFGEIMPKSIALRANEAASVRVAPVFQWLVERFEPAIRVINRASLGLIRFSDRFLPPLRPTAAPEELKTMIEIGHHRGLFEPFEREVIGRLMDFKRKRVREIMTPRVDVFTLPAEATFSEAAEEARVRGLSFMPVTGGEPEAVAGVLHLKDLLVLEERDMNRPVIERVRPPYFVPETKRIDELFRELQSRRLRNAVVVGESDIFLGLVTLDDILGQIIGEIRYQREARSFDFRRIDADSIIAAGNLKLDNFNRAFKTDLSDRYYETLAGYLISRCGSIPVQGSAFEYDGLRFTVLRSQPNRIERIKVVRLPGGGSGK